ncbi:unnamed protein product [Ceratitis capitata]|uniref:(Mediterranean fruit fly) hypothetical protein n=1 Tax=Ceratitis capitata TaxID=7213 RepID=A0A811UIZ8_CERCA|nr:unnamed protein product [Ceratitis capitata]
MDAQNASISQKMDAQMLEKREQISSLEGTIAQIPQNLVRNNAELKERQDLIETEVNALESRFRELQLNRATPSVSAPKVKTPSFDGKIPFQVFKLQFEKTAETNNWSIEEKSAALFVALEGPAAELLITTD